MNDPEPTDPETNSTATTEAVESDIHDQDLKEVAGGIRATGHVPSTTDHGPIQPQGSHTL